MSRQSHQAHSTQQRRHSKITVEYHRPSRESIQEYNDLLADANLHAATAQAASYRDPYAPVRQAPPPPTYRPKTPNDSSPVNTPPRIRNSLQKPNPRARKNSFPSAHPPPRTADIDPFAANPTPSAHPKLNGMNTVVSPPPPRPSRANTATLNDIFPTAAPAPTTLATRRLSTPTAGTDVPFYTDLSEPLPSPQINEYTHVNNNTSPQSSSIAPSRNRSSTTKSKKGMLGFMSEFLNTPKRPEISTPYDPVHLTHVGFNSSTGEFTGLPKEWQQLLQESGISRSEQEKNPLAVMEIVKFYQEGHGDVWDKMNGMGAFESQSGALTQVQDGFHNPASISALSLVFFFSLTQMSKIACSTRSS
jgi:p21-activated kinase 1